jgi:hypothetical protein
MSPQSVYGCSRFSSLLYDAVVYSLSTQDTTYIRFTPCIFGVVLDPAISLYFLWDSI